VFLKKWRLVKARLVLFDLCLVKRFGGFMLWF